MELCRIVRLVLTPHGAGAQRLLGERRTSATISSAVGVASWARSPIT